MKAKRASIVLGGMLVAGLVLGATASPAEAQCYPAYGYYYAPPVYAAPAPVYVPPPVVYAPPPVYYPHYRAYSYRSYYPRYYHPRRSFGFGFSYFRR
jgi:hypothetical protein